MVVRLTPARRATSSRATLRKPCRSNSTSAASRMVSPASAPGIAGLGELAVAHRHRQFVPGPVDRAGPAECGEPLVVAFLALGPGQAQQVARPRWQPAGGDE